MTIGQFNGADCQDIGSIQSVSTSGALGSLYRTMQPGDDAGAAPTAAATVGDQIKIRTGDVFLFADVCSVRIDPEQPDKLAAEINFIAEGQIRPDGLPTRVNRGITHFPQPGDKIYAVTAADLHELYATDERKNVVIGTVHPSHQVAAALFLDPLLSRHFALVGSTGTGKSTAAALILGKIIEKSPEGHVVVLDPHGEYASAFPDAAAPFNVANIRLPYWLMNFEEHCEVFVSSEGPLREIEKDILAKCLLVSRAKHEMARALPKITVDSPIPYLIGDFLGEFYSQMGKLEKTADASHYMRLRMKIEELISDQRYQFMFDPQLYFEPLEGFLKRTLRLAPAGKPISIIDLSGVPSEIVDVVVAVISRIIFDFALWAKADTTRPILLVCDEAQRYLPAERLATGLAARKALERIAKEGRKYGISLGLITQRPYDLSEGALSQCGTILAMRLNNERDHNQIKKTVPEGARGILDLVPALRNRECIVCGEGTTIPMRIRFEDVPQRLRPSSDDPSFSALWEKSTLDEELLARIVERWRKQGH